MATLFETGRLLNHVHLHVTDLDRSLRFYIAVTTALGKGDLVEEGEGYFRIDELLVDGDSAPEGAPMRVAFPATEESAVERFHRAGIEAGGRCVGSPAIRAIDRSSCYAARLLDPDGNWVEACFFTHS